MVGLCAMFYVLDQPFEYSTSPKEKNGIHLYSIKMVGLSSIQMAFDYQTIWHLTSFGPFKYLTSSVFRLVQYSDQFGIQIPTVVTFWSSVQVSLENDA